MSKPTWINDVTLDQPNRQVMVDFFLLSGYHVVSYLSRLKHSEMELGSFENLANSVPNPLLPYFSVKKYGGGNTRWHIPIEFRRNSNGTREYRSV